MAPPLRPKGLGPAARGAASRGPAPPSRFPRPVLPGGRFCGNYQHHLRHPRSRDRRKAVRRARYCQEGPFVANISITSDTSYLGTGAKPFAAPSTARRALLWQISASPPTPQISPHLLRPSHFSPPDGQLDLRPGENQHRPRRLRSPSAAPGDGGDQVQRRRHSNRRHAVPPGGTGRWQHHAGPKSSGADTPFHQAAPGGGSTMQDPSPAAPPLQPATTALRRFPAAPRRAAWTPIRGPSPSPVKLVTSTWTLCVRLGLLARTCMPVCLLSPPDCEASTLLLSPSFSFSSSGRSRA